MKLNQAQLEAKLKVFRARALSLTGVTTAGQPLGLAVGKFFDDLLKNSTDPEHLKQRDEFMKRAESDPKVREQLCAIRIENFSNYVMASTHFMDFFFEVVNLANDERPIHQNTARQETKLFYVGPDGGHKMLKINPEQDEALIPLKWLSTETVRYRKVDIYRGSIVDAALQTINLAEDAANQIDGLCQNLLLNGSIFGDFVFTGKKSKWTFVPNSRVHASNLVTTNDLKVYSTGTTFVGKFGFPVLDEIIDYSARMGGAYPGGFTCTGRILVPPTHIKEIKDGITPAGSTSNKIADELLEQGYFGVNYQNRNWLFVPDNTLDPGKGRCYPEFSRKAGRVYLKPGLTEEKTVTTPELDRNNEEERYMKQPFGAAINETSRPLVCSVQYKEEE